MNYKDISVYQNLQFYSQNNSIIAGIPEAE